MYSSDTYKKFQICMLIFFTAIVLHIFICVFFLDIDEG
jgi:hypothetical protein